MKSANRTLRHRCLVSCVLTALLAGCATSAGPVVGSREAVLHDILRASVQIVVESGGSPLRWGSGVVVAERTAGAESECLVLTAGHTLAPLPGGEEVSVLLDRNQPAAVRARAEVIAVRDTEKVDLALLKIRSNRCFPVAMGGAPSLGDPIWVVGFPRGGNMTLATGIVSQVDPTADGRGSRFTVDASASHGSSGGGVFEASTGRLLGIVEAFGTARVSVGAAPSSPFVDVPMPGMTYVTPVPRIDEFLRTVGYGDRVPRSQASR